MEFGWTPAEVALQARMRALGEQAQRAPVGTRMSVLAEGGALGLCLPEAYGGGGYSFVATASAYEAMGETLNDAGLLLAAGAHLFGVASMISNAGTDSQKTDLLPALATGEKIATVAATEADAGSDIASVEGTSIESESGFLVSANKRYVTYAQRADLYFLVVRHETNKATVDAARSGLNALIVSRTGEGIEVSPPYELAGLSSSCLAAVRFVDCPVATERLIGKRGAGLAVFQIAMAFERALILAFRLGALKRSLAKCVQFARKRRVGGTPIANHQAVSHRIARMHRRLNAARLVVYQAAWALDQGKRAQAEAALAKWTVADAAIESSLDHFALLGGQALLSESGAASELLDTLGGGIHSGTPDVLATIVARWLGL